MPEKKSVKKMLEVCKNGGQQASIVTSTVGQWSVEHNLVYHLASTDCTTVDDSRYPYRITDAGWAVLAMLDLEDD